MGKNKRSPQISSKFSERNVYEKVTRKTLTKYKKNQNSTGMNKHEIRQR